MMTLPEPAPATKLNSGLVVANFSSPHVFNFDDGTILGRCPESRVNAGSIENRREFGKGPKGVTLVKLVPKVNASVRAMLTELENDDSIHLVIVSAYILRAIHGLGYTKPVTSWMIDKPNSIVSSTHFGLDQGD